jgi:crossover junction endodeoxyribonuclease RuvC
MRVLAVDPGYERLGVAILEKEGGVRETLLYSDCIKTPKEDAFPKRLHFIGKRVEELIQTYAPTHLALEQLYFNTNQKTALSVAEVRGVITYLGGVHNLTICQYTPSQVKSAVIGYGKGTKQQIAQMVHQLITIDKKISYDDEYDAIAVGITCTASER